MAMRGAWLASWVAGAVALGACSSGNGGVHIPPGDATDAATDGAAGSGPVALACDAAPSADGAGTDAPDSTHVAPTSGCGMPVPLAVGVTVRATIQTMGTKAPDCADSKCGAWAYEREYFVRLPPGYDNTTPLPLVLQGTGCGGTGKNIYQLDPDVAMASIMVGLTPPPNDIGHSTNLNQLCYDDREGDDSVEFVFYEALHDQLAAELCFDRNRVFAAGRGSGGWLANELGCKYAGDPTRPVRAVLSDNGGFPTEPKYTPTCTGTPVAGIWMYAALDPAVVGPASVAISRAATVNGCQVGGVGSTLHGCTVEDFPIGGGNADSTCVRLLGCAAPVPVVVCSLPLGNQSGHDAVAVPGFSTLIRLFEKAPLLAP
jgi:poly(3-hydroxybutyrate) depolymerase